MIKTELRKDGALLRYTYEETDKPIEKEEVLYGN